MEAPFAALAFSNASAELSKPVKISAGLSVHPNFPNALPESWCYAIGTFHADELARVNLLLLASDHELVNTHGEVARAEERIWQLFRALHLVGVPSYDAITMLRGRGFDSMREVTHISSWDNWLRLDNEAALMVSDKCLPLVSELTRSILVQYQHQSIDVPAFRRGHRYFEKAMQEKFPESRLIQVVRALDVILRTRKGNGEKDFKARCQAICGASDDNNTALGEIYDLRSKSVHGGTISDVYTDVSDDVRNQLGMLRVKQAEALARHAFKTLLMSTELQQHFATRESTERFWSLSYDEQRSIWGSAVEL